MKTLMLSSLAFLTLALIANAERVVKISDGDTITVIDENNVQTRVRLWGIDAPEKKQPFGEASRKHLAEKIAGENVRLESRGRDRYGRLLAVVWLGDENENLRQVRDGYAWHYVQYAKKATDYAAAEKQAREKRLGLWQEDDPTPPWTFRRRRPTKKS